MISERRPIGTIAYLGGLPAILEKFCWSFAQMVAYSYEYLCNPGEYVHIDRATISLHSFARNSLVDRFKGDWLLMLDTDHEPEPDLPARMINVANRLDVGVLTAIYQHRANPNPPVIYEWVEGTDKLLPIIDWDKDVSAIPIGAAGAGALLVRRWVFAKIMSEFKVHPFERDQTLGEDFSFFKRCRELKIPVYAATKIESPHLEVRPIRMADYKPISDGVNVSEITAFV